MLHGEIIVHELFYDVSFAEVISWFIPCYLGIFKETEMCPTLLNGKPVNLITLYQVVKDYGGFKKVIEDDAWNSIAVQCGFDCEDAQEVKITYVRYVDLLEWYFDVMKFKRNEKKKWK
ncbi:putative transcription factor & chromatin remodeling ARID family [Helianthus anomalus]